MKNSFFKMWSSEEDSGIIIKGYPSWMIVAVVSVVFICMTLMVVFR